jgi:hypothetical protein
MGFVKYPLYTRDRRIAVYVWIPPFEPECEILRWGDRYFQWDGKGYVEAFCFDVWPNMVTAT